MENITYPTPASCLGTLPDTDTIMGFSFWDASGVQCAWETFLEHTQRSHGADSFQCYALLTVGVTYCLLLVLYWGLGFLLLPLDFWEAAHAKFLRVKCQPSKRMTHDMVMSICKDVLLQHLTLYPVFLLLGVPVLRERLLFDRQLPSYKTVAWQIPMFILVSETWFYYVHRALHHKRIYRYVHKKHHKYTYPVALECLYFHPVESVLNFGVVGIGPLVCGSHVVLLYLWTAVALILILLHHCGYEVPYDDVGRGSMTMFHDFHHEKFDVNFGVTGWLDWLHGTDTGFPQYAERWKRERSEGCTEWRKCIQQKQE